VASGLSDEHVARFGRWKSDAYKAYVFGHSDTHGWWINRSKLESMQHVNLCSIEGEGASACVVIRMLTGKRFVIVTNTGRTVGWLKSEIQRPDRAGIHPFAQRLVYDGAVLLDDNATLSSLGNTSVPKVFHFQLVGSGRESCCRRPQRPVFEVPLRCLLCGP